MNNGKQKKSIAVIGSGMAGLTAAAYLARAGHSVRVYEQYPEPGGVTRTLHKDGFSWDLGPLLLDGFGEGDPGTAILHELGITENLATEARDRGIVFPDFSLWKPEIFEGSLWRKNLLLEEFPDEHAGLGRYYRFYDRMCRLMNISSRLQEPGGKKVPAGKLRLALNFLPLRKYKDWTAAELMEHMFKSPRLRAVYTGILADLMVKPGEFPALGVPAFNLETAFDARMRNSTDPGASETFYRYIRNGCENLVSAVAGSLEDAGGIIRTSADVSRIIIENGRAAGLVINEQTEKFDAVVFSGCARKLMSMLPDPHQLGEEYSGIINGQIRMESVFMVHLGLNFKPEQKSALCYYYGTYDIENAVNEIRNGKYHEGRHGFLIYIPSMHSPGMAPENYHAVTIYTVAPNFIADGDWEREREIYADRLVAEAERRVPGLSAGTVSRMIVSPADFRLMIKQDHHSFGGIAPVMGRPNPGFQTPVKDLWFIGSQSESGGGILGVMKGAKTAVARILDSI